MDTPLKTYVETKSRALLYGSIIFVPMIIIALHDAVSVRNDPLYASNFIWRVIVFLIIFGLIVYFLPSAKLKVYKDRFSYTRGKLSLESSWSEVHTIAFQIHRGRHGGAVIPTAFLIETAHGVTKLIDTKILKSKESNQYVDLPNFVRELESISNKEITWGETSTKRYRKVSFVNYLKGQGL